MLLFYFYIVFSYSCMIGFYQESDAPLILKIFFWLFSPIVFPMFVGGAIGKIYHKE